MKERVEGTIVLDGLLEGRLVGDTFTAADLRRWAERAAEKHLHFSVEVDGGTFSILGLRTAVASDDVGMDPARVIAAELEDLLADMPLEVRSSALSTLRSTEYRKGEEIQTLYVLVPGGGLDVRQRSVQADTAAPAEPLTGKQKVRIALVGLAVAVAIFLVSSVFVDYRAMLSRAAESFTPLSAADIAVDTGPFAGSFTVAKKELSRDPKALVLTLKRTDSYPRTDEDLQKRFDQAKDIRSHMLVESLARGCVRCECFDKEGKFLYSAIVRIGELRSKEKLEAAVALPAEGPRVAKVVLTY